MPITFGLAQNTLVLIKSMYQNFFLISELNYYVVGTQTNSLTYVKSDGQENICNSMHITYGGNTPESTHNKLLKMI